MLHLSPSHRFAFQHPENKHLALSPVPDEDDELIRAIEADRGETWQLDPMPDTTALGEFWAGVEDDLHNDPTWVSFSDDE